MKSTLCGCGNVLKYGNDIETKCNMPCDGNNNENCGGYYYYSVYFTGIFIIAFILINKPIDLFLEPNIFFNMNLGFS